jgi:hypothetical protein
VNHDLSITIRGSSRSKHFIITVAACSVESNCPAVAQWNTLGKRENRASENQIMIWKRKMICHPE